MSTAPSPALPAAPRRLDPPHDARAVANTFLDMAADAGQPVDHLKLQKLVYFAHGWHLAVVGRPLFFQDVVAWPYGPVVKAVYDEFKEYGRDPIDGRAAFFDPDRGEWAPYLATYSDPTQAVLSRVWDGYKGYTGSQLSGIAHEKGTPWFQMTEHLDPKAIRDLPIPNPLIRQHYLKLARPKAPSPHPTTPLSRA